MAPLEMEAERRDDAVILRVTGEVDSYTAPLLHERLAGVFAEAKGGTVVLDMSRVSFLASSGLSVLVDYHTRGEEQGTRLKVVAPAGNVLRALRATTLNEMIELYATVPDALAAR
ncbi:anti-sigma B factor antagonist [Lentzea atacamensis]|uniref:Anti-sigma factor antagonist n=2 Tax=Lentzea TaxID=165301 RepID=A0A316I1H3_9PSEU|nr:STAS domain-containing protein [Lentzea atacamensis]PWK87236.1 anti-sigma B factor antagonist [Lentzea atacamensis]RAS70061.1 anti-sigma B factor antagonist [Lentzea atacamensis]